MLKWQSKIVKISDLIDAHHEKYKLDSTHNAKMGNLKRQRLLKRKQILIVELSKADIKREEAWRKKDEELLSSMKQDLAEKFKEYRELVQERKLKEAKSRKEPEVYHHFKKREN